MVASLRDNRPGGFGAVEWARPLGHAFSWSGTRLHAPAELAACKREQHLAHRDGPEPRAAGPCAARANR